MIYLVAILLPPLALLLYGQVVQALLNFVIWLAAIIIFVITLTIFAPFSAALWLVCVVHAILTINRVHNDRRNRDLIDAIKRSEK